MALPILTLGEAWVFEVMCALAVHLVYNKFEVPPSNVAATFALLFVVPLLPAYFLFPRHLLHPTWLIIPLSCSAFHSTLALSIVAYRVSPLHPLAEFPGPRLARVSQLWAAMLTAGGKRHKYLKKLHDQHGPFVRIGPNELSCIDASAIPHVLGPEGLPKGPIWDARSVPGGIPSLIALRDPVEHQRRRKLWNRALSSASVKEYEETLTLRVLSLADELDKRSVHDGIMCGGAERGTKLDLAMWMSFFAFDFMGDMAFGGGFDFLRYGDNKGIWHSLESGLEQISMMQHWPWLTDVLWKVPLLISERVNFVKFAMGLVKDRVEKGSQKRDLFHYLIDEDNLEPVKPPFRQIVSDAMLAVVAGSDTTATTLGSIFHNLLTHRDAYERLQDEVDTIFPPGEGDPLESSKLSEMPYLNAVINEGLRLAPPLPTNIQRATPRDNAGKWLGIRFVPPGTTINIPAYSLHRCETYFSPKPDAFWPDRWLRGEHQQPLLRPKGINDASAVTTNTAAFIPFSFGPANCVGKNLAMLEMRMIVALLMSRFDMRLASDYDPADWGRDQEDFFAMKNGQLPVVLRRRMY